MKWRVKGTPGNDRSVTKCAEHGSEDLNTSAETLEFFFKNGLMKLFQMLNHQQLSYFCRLLSDVVM